MRRKLAALFGAAAIICTLTLTAGIVLAANPSADLDQCANGQAPSPSTDGCATNANEWVNGNLGPSKSVYVEGDSIPYRLRFGNLPLSSHVVRIEWDTTKAGKHAIDYITDFNESVANANPCLGVSACNAAVFNSFAIPNDPQVTGAGVTPLAGAFRIYGGTITAVSAYSYSNGNGFAGDKSAGLAITFTASRANPVLAWGGHIATRLDWGSAGSAVSISGSPYHTRLLDLNGSGGNQDRSLSAAAVIFPGSITITKDVFNGTDAQDFAFSTTGGLSPSTFSLDDDGNNANDLSNIRTFGGIQTFGTYTVTEGALAGWSLQSLSCSVTSANGGSSSANLGTRTATINLAEGESYSCTFVNFKQNPALTIDKVDDTGTYDEPGDVINYTITATNTGNVTLTNVTVTDPNADTLVCTPTIPVASLAPGGVIDCDATIVITQADVDAGSVFNAACVDDGAGGAAEACDNTTTTGENEPELTIDKVDDTGTYDEPGDVINYTITATNTGNVTLTNVTVTDPNADTLVCTPTIPVASLAPGGVIDCDATIVITQADVDAGSVFNAACVDDGAGGAAEACDNTTTTGENEPELTIDKVDDTGTYDEPGDVINYTITATNTGNVTLTNVTVTDPNADTLVCTPTIPVASLAPGGVIDCDATIVITQADVDAGSVFNAACVDDGAGGAAEACDNTTTTGDQNPALLCREARRRRELRRRRRDQLHDHGDQRRQRHARRRGRHRRPGRGPHVHPDAARRRLRPRRRHQLHREPHRHPGRPGGRLVLQRGLRRRRRGRRHGGRRAGL